MKQVQYLGSGVRCLARFNSVKTGDKLDMFEWEYDSVSGNSEYKLLTPVPSKEESDIASRVKPTLCREFDLSSVPWEDPRLFIRMLSKMSKAILVKIIRAINEVGGHIRGGSNYDSRESLVDRIIEASRYMGWDKLSTVDRILCGKQTREVPIVNEQTSEQVHQKIEVEVHRNPEPPKIARHRVRKQIGK